MPNWRYTTKKLARDKKTRAQSLGALKTISPLLPTLVSKIPEGEHWLHEIKWDGYRVSCYLENGVVRVFTRNLNDWTDRFPAIVEAVEGLPAETAIIDGEAIVNDEQGRSSFSAIQQALGKGGDTSAIQLVVFDLLHLNGEDLRDRPLEQRRAALEKLVAGNAALTISEEIEGDPETVLAHGCKLGLEGIVSKQRDSLYRSGRRKEWVKTKCIQSDEFVVIGYELGKGFGGLGRLHLGRYQDGKLIEIGGVGTGFNERTAREVIERLEPLKSDKPPVKGLRRKAAIWTRPELIVEVQYRGWTDDGHLRHPSYKGIREDKTPADLGAPA